MNFPQLNLESPERLPLALAGIAIAALIVAWLYKMRGDASASSWNRLPPILRVLALGSLLLSITKPAIVRSQKDAMDGELAVLLDRSHSMSVSDPERTPAQCIGIADACGLLADGVRSIEGREAIAATRAMHQLAEAVGTARSEVEYAQLAGHGASAAAQRLHAACLALQDAAAALQKQITGRASTVRLFAICRDIGRQVEQSETTSITNEAYQRLRQTVEAAAAAAEDPQNAADETLYRTDSDARAAADSVAAMSRVEIGGRVLRQLREHLPSGVDLSIRDASPALKPVALNNDLIADGESSDLGGALMAERDDRHQRKLLAVVLISDGRQVGGSYAPVALDVPLIAMNAGAAVRHDVSIAAVDAPVSIRLHERSEISVTVQAVGVHEQPVDVSIDDAGVMLDQHAVVSDGKTVFQFAMQFESGGLRDLIIHLATSMPDLRPANKTMLRFVQVCDEPIGVGFLKSGSNDNETAIHAMLPKAPWIRSSMEAISSTSGDADRLLSDDVLIVDDPRADTLPAARCRAINDWVRRGGGLIIVAGPDFDAAALSANSALEPLLPWREETAAQLKTWPPDSAGAIVIPADASPVTHSNDSASDVRRRWAELPGIHALWSMPTLKNGVASILVEAETGRAVLTESHFGAGRVLFLATGEADRWRGKLNQREPDSFWLSLIREAAGAPFSTQIPAGALDVQPSVISPGRQAMVRVKCAGSEKHVSVELMRDGQPIDTIPLKAVANDSTTHQFIGLTPALSLGEYIVRSNLAGTGNQLVQRLRVEPNFEPEIADLNPDEGNLRRLARASDGEYLPITEATILMDRIRDLHERVPSTSRYELWDSGLLYFFVLGCLTLEWATRKMMGLV